MEVTIKSVAKEAGVSISTVSRVVNAPEGVRDETKRRVLDAMEKLDYRPNAVARSLSSKRTRTLGLIVPNVSDFFVSELYKGVNRAATSRGMKVILYDSDSNQSRVVLGVEFMKEHRVDGIIVSSDYIPSAHDNMLKRLKIPVVLTLTESPSAELPSFKTDDVGAAFDTVKYLVSRGHTKIAMISGHLKDEVSGKSRFNGYQMALKHFNINYDERLVAYGDWRYQHGYAAMTDLLANRAEVKFTAVFAASDEMAVGAMRCLYDNNLRVPEDISVVGFDDIAMADMVTPKLTTVRQSFEQIGSEAVHYIIDLLEGKSRPANGGSHYIPYQVIGRESVTVISDEALD
ncbi:LacI family DNA-binding transcriptional regulator [Alicyclobacillus sp. SO9]|uniref:LacI family DNA-binding transcriptional regulator n=1 Tax=Alicyclobacillus sp. SO9 TaxID=2665646 RepID=UPI0018E7A717|nr:LacI family DNA-binding transcriptional regulator [Alicyclobacillus sp. SO9]QQE78719.1 LacI family DNA-binding transcriptional regulator [Alicyclobacillus sp. SO9]